MENAETASKNLKFVHNMESFLIPYYNINQRPTHSGQIQLRKGDLNYEKNLFVQYVVMFTRETLHRLNVQSVMHQLINSKSRQEKDLGLQSTL